MTGHQINSLVGDLVAMAQAMERLPQVEAELATAKQHIDAFMLEKIQHSADLSQSRDYAASLEAKVHDLEVARDDAELRFLEADEKLSKFNRAFEDVVKFTKGAYDDVEPLVLPKPIEPTTSGVNPIAEDPTPMAAVFVDTTSQPAGHTEANASTGSVPLDPTAGKPEAVTHHDVVETVASVSGQPVAGQSEPHPIQPVASMASNSATSVLPTVSVEHGQASKSTDKTDTSADLEPMKFDRDGWRTGEWINWCARQPLPRGGW